MHELIPGVETGWNRIRWRVARRLIGPNLHANDIEHSVILYRSNFLTECIPLCYTNMSKQRWKENTV